MAANMDDKHRLAITKGTSSEINKMRYGAHLTISSGKTIDELIFEACQDRFHLAFGFLQSARHFSRPPNIYYRAALARAYYAIYHAARSIAFLHHRGDDYEEHKVLPKHLPHDFQDRLRWENDIKDARLERNRADYDPYPKGDRAFRGSSKTIIANAEEFLPLVRAYLRRKGCKL